jgi:hypothetical protein
MTDLLQLFHDLGRLTSAEGDDAKTQFSELCAMANTKHKEMFQTFTRDQKLAVIYGKLLAVNEKQGPLWKVVITVMTLHSYALVESGFSVNKELLIKNMEEDTIVAQRIVFDAMRLADMDLTRINISKKMMADVRQSRAAYDSALQRKKDKQSEEEKLTSKDRKRKSMIVSLQQQKKQKLAELNSEAAAIDSKIASLQRGIVNK